MKRMPSRAIAQRAQLSPQDFVGLCSAAMWGLAALYLLATFQVY